MKRTNNRREAIVELGTARKVTKGNWGPYSDDVIMQQIAGLCAD